jgi:hypothetical protein
MKLAIYSESPADEAAIRILANAILGRETQAMDPPPLRARGWPSVRDLLPAVYKHLYYQTDADGLIVVVDSDRAQIHHADHERPDAAPNTCRLCELRRVVARLQGSVRERQGRGPLRIGVGVATPAIEAWYATGVDPHVNEATWMRAMRDNQFPYTKPSLKSLIYATERPSIELETERATSAAIRLTGKLGDLEESFPSGFGPLAEELRRWT